MKRGSLALIFLFGVYCFWPSKEESDISERATSVPTSEEYAGQSLPAVVKGTSQVSSQDEPDLILPILDHDELLLNAKAEEKVGRRVFATARLVDVAPHSAGKWEVSGDEARWDFTLRSEGARSLNLGFSEFRLPPGGALTIRDPSGESKPVTFTDRDHDTHGQLWTPLFATDTLHLALSVPAPLASEVRLRLSKSNHGFRPPTQQRNEKAIGDGISGSCNIDVICDADENSTFGPVINLFRDQIRATAAYTLAGVETCSGALINNTANDLKPYFLTANHCGISPANAASVVVYWNFENSVCRTPGSVSSGEDGDGPITEFNSGSIFRAARVNSDFCLIELDDPVDASTSPYYTGWDRSGDNPSSVVGIHHPAVSEKRISFEFDSTTTTDGFSNSTTSSGTHVRVSDWDFGTTEGGSSGSPLFDDRGRLIGQLEGGGAACGNDLSDWYGRFSRSWADGGSAATQLSDWLDPAQTGLVEIEGINSDEILTVTGGSITEGDQGQVTFEAVVSLNEATTETVTVMVSTQDDTATSAGGDYVTVNQTLTFAPGEITKTVPISIQSDLEPEENETFQLVLSNAVNASASSQSAVVAILNDDFIPPVVNSPLTVSAFANEVFEYRITALNTPSSFGISDAPAGMVVDELTGVLTWQPPSAGEVTVDLLVRNSAGENVDTLTITVLPNTLIEALDLNSDVIISSSNPSWILQDVITYDGVDSAQAGQITHRESTTMTLEVSGPDRLTFFWRVSSEVGFDWLSFAIDGEAAPGVDAISGEQDWAFASVVIPSGSHLLSWSYTKDRSEDSGSDTGWVDDVRLASGAQPVVWTAGRHEFVSGREIRVPVSFINEEGFSFQNLPAWLSYDEEGEILSGLPPSAGETIVTVIASNAQGSHIVPVTISVEPQQTELATAIEQPELSVTTSGTQEWFVDSPSGAVGGTAARSGSIVDSEQSALTLRVQGPGTMTFRWMVSSEGGFDFFSYQINGEVQNSISGDVPWEVVSVNLVPGVNEITWSYSKDFSVSEGEDLGRVDQVTLSGYARFLTDHQVDHLSAFPDDDDDRDGRSLFGEYAFLTDPGDADSDEILQLNRSAGLLNLTFSGLGTASDVSYLLERSSGLNEDSWSPVTTTPQITANGAGFLYQYPAIPFDEDLRAEFYRVRAVFRTGP